MPHDALPDTLSANTLQREAAMMNLEALIAEREVIRIDPLPIPQAELLTRYEKLYTGAVSDVLREHCLMDQALPGHLVPLRPERTVAGIAFTVVMPEPQPISAGRYSHGNPVLSTSRVLVSAARVGMGHAAAKAR